MNEMMSRQLAAIRQDMLIAELRLDRIRSGIALTQRERDEKADLELAVQRARVLLEKFSPERLAKKVGNGQG